MNGLKVKPRIEGRSLYLLVPKDLVLYFNITEETEASISIMDKGDGRVSLSYIFKKGVAEE